MKRKVELPKIRFKNKKLFVCYASWLFTSFVIGSLFSNYINIGFFNNIFFVKGEMVKEIRLYQSIMTCVFLLSPCAFIYIYRSGISVIKLRKEHLWVPILATIMGLLWNTGTITIKQQGYYQYDVLARHLIQKFDWVAAVFLSWFGLFMAIQFGAVLFVYFIKGDVNHE